MNRTIVIKSTLPTDSRLSNRKYDYVDSFQGTFLDQENKITSVDVTRAFFSSAPKWVGELFKLRNKAVSLFGLKTSGDSSSREKQLEHFKCEPGERLGLFKVFDKTESEVILGENDKHLNFRVSLFLKQDINQLNKKVLIISTTVEFNNAFGRLYFLPVQPFHNLIVPAMLKGIINQLEQQNGQELSLFLH